MKVKSDQFVELAVLNGNGWTNNMFLVLNFWRLALFTILSRDLKVLHLDYECSGQYLLGIGLLHQRINPHVKIDDNEMHPH